MTAFPLAARVLALCALAAFTSTLCAQPVWQWALRGNTTNNFDHVYGRGIVTDATGNVYVAGTFSATTTFGNPNVPLTSFGSSDAFLAKYNPQGQFQWARNFGSPAADWGHAIALGADSYIYVAGRYSATGTFGSVTLTNENFAQAFILKFDPATTNVVWAQDDGLEWWGVAADGSGNSYVVGAPLGLQVAGSKLAGPIALAKYNASGVRQWYTNSLAPNLTTSGSGRAIAVDAGGNVYITGVFRRIIEFGPTSLTNAASANNTRDEIFVAKLSTAGIPQWARRGGGEGDDQGLAIGVDGTGNVIVTGSCDATTSLNGGTSVAFDIGGFSFPDAVGGGFGNMFLVKFNSSGTGQWAKKIGGTSFGTGLHATSTGEFYVGGYFKGNSLDFGGVTLTQAATLEEVFALKYDASGNAVWGRCTTSTNAGTRFGRAIVSHPGGAVYETGEYLGAFPTIFDATVLDSKSTAASMFVTKLAASAPGGPTVTALTLLGGGMRRMTIPGANGNSYVVEASNTPGGFTAIATNVVTGGLLEFTDPGAGPATRFYRLRSP